MMLIGQGKNNHLVGRCSPLLLIPYLNRQELAKDGKPLLQEITRHA
jgi:hypothetical protein